jgi:putative ABC transport system permease protein
MLGRLLASIIFGISPRDAAVFAAVPVLLTVAILFACYVPAYRAARIDPMIALRYE